MQLVCDKGGCPHLTACCVGFLNGFCQNGAAGQAKFLQLNCGGTLDAWAAWGFQRHDLGVALWGAMAWIFMREGRVLSPRLLSCMLGVAFSSTCWLAGHSKLSRNSPEGLRKIN